MGDILNAAFFVFPSKMLEATNISLSLGKDPGLNAVKTL